jgi:putative Ca2+/H+ antiporter (TMEM165/GDT1 family)
MEAVAVSMLVVAVAEIGDRTQLLSLVLASRFRRPLPILAGILAATLANHAVAAAAGAWIGVLLPPAVMRWGLGLSFLAMAGWALIPDKLDAEAVPRGRSKGIFLCTLVSFFLTEIGDKTQFATAALGARFHTITTVVIGTTLGMMIANLPVVIGGHLAGGRLNLRWARYAAALLLAAQGIMALLGQVPGMP